MSTVPCPVFTSNVPSVQTFGPVSPVVFAKQPVKLALLPATEPERVVGLNTGPFLQSVSN